MRLLTAANREADWALSLERSYDNPERLCPVPAGPALLKGTCWVIRTAQGEVSINAPHALLDRVARACDGGRSLTQIVEETRPASLRPKVNGLISDLLDKGVLVDANMFTVAAQRFAWIPSAFGTPAERAVWQKVPLRFSITPENKLGSTALPLISPLGALLDQRRSTRTYDDTCPLDEAALRTYLWLLCGVVQAESQGDAAVSPRRTIPSGGAVHALRPLLVLQRAVGSWSPGVYAVTYPAVRCVALERIHSDATWLPRAVVHPWNLKHSTGMVFLVADPRLGAIKYRSRALQYTFIEAGAALQNAGLAAPALGIAMSVYGGYVETVTAEGLRLDENDIVLSSLVFGSAPTAKQVALASQAWPMDFEWVDWTSPIYSPPYHLAHCHLELPGDLPVDAWGRDLDPWNAFVKSALASIERLGYGTPQNVALGRLIDWKSAIDPRSVIRYADAQYRSPSFPFQPFDEHSVCGWAEGRAFGRGDRVKVLAEQVYALKSLKKVVPGAFAGYTESNLSGCAAHVDEKQAVDYALLELIETDAYMRSWLLQKPGIALALRSLPADLKRRIKVLQDRGCRVSLQQLPSPWAPVCVAYAQHEARHFTVVGAAARPSMADAVAAAVDKMETLAYVNLNGPRSQRLSPRNIKTPADHSALYTLPRYFRRADALFETTEAKTFSAAARAADTVEPIAQGFLNAGRELIVVDITVPGSSIDQGRTPVTVVRVFAPGLLPATFGYNREPLGLLDRFDPRGRFPHPFS